MAIFLMLRYVNSGGAESSGSLVWPVTECGRLKELVFDLPVKA